MGYLLIYFFMGISLSIDAFTLAFSLATNSLDKKQEIKIVFLIGMFHFLMPMLGSKIGFLLRQKPLIKPNILASIIFVILIIEMIKDKKEQDKKWILTNIVILIITISVSIDSLSIGIVLAMNKEKVLLASLIFSMVSSITTQIGFLLGEKITEKCQKQTSLIGIINLIILAIYYIFKG